MLSLVKFLWIVVPAVFMAVASWRVSKSYLAKAKRSGEIPDDESEEMVQGFMIVMGLIFGGLLGFFTKLAFNKFVQYGLEGSWYELMGQHQIWTTNLNNEWLFKIIFALGYIVLLAIVTFFTWHAHRGIDVPSDAKLVAILWFLVFLTGGTLYFLGFGNGFAKPFLLWKHAQAFGVNDPVLKKDLSWYAFKLPMYKSLAGMASWTAVSLLFYTLTIHVGFSSNFNPVLIEEKNRLPRDTEKKYFSRLETVPVILMAILVATWAVKHYLTPDSLVLDGSSTQVTGASATDIVWRFRLAHVGFVGASIWAAFFFIRSWLRTSITAFLAWSGLIFYPLFLLFAFFIIPGFYQGNRVAPDEFNREKAQLEYQIKFTRWAYQLDDIESTSVPFTTELSGADYALNDPTLSEARIVDWPIVRRANNQINEVNKMYTFLDTDINQLGNQLVMGSVREIDLAEIPNKTWQNEHLVYTHGNCFTLADPSAIQLSGYPVFSFDVQDCLSATATSSDVFPALQTADIYFGEAARGWYILHTTRGDIEAAPSAETETVTTEYAGSGIGLKMGGTWNRFKWAWWQRDDKLLTSSMLGKNSEIVLYPNIIDRIQKLAPFLVLDPDPYFIVDQHVMWVIDGYTTLSGLPYVASYDGHSYLRNSVKIVIDAYTGETTFYAFDATDPVLKTWSSIYPDLFTDVAQMPKIIREQIRYPEYLFSAQTQVLLRYHQTNPQGFYNNQGQWSIPAEAYQTWEQTMAPRYQWMTLPGETERELVLSLPFTLSGKKNLAGWLVARNAEPHYGEMRLLLLPQNQVVWGPESAQGTIQQDEDLSAKMSLWNQQGSSVIWGNMLTFLATGSDGKMSPVYLKPMYIASSQAGAAPTLARVLIVYGEGKLIASQSLQGALAQLYQGLFNQQVDEPITTGNNVQNPGATQSSVDNVAPASIDTTIALDEQALGYFNAAQVCLQSSDWQCYGENMTLLEQALETLVAQ